MVQLRMTTPTLTVLIAAYNSAKTLPVTLASLAAQTVPAEEIVVVDDGSTDRTRQVCEQFAAANRRLNVRVQTQLNAGPGAARNTGLKMAASEYVAFLDADDAWRAEKIAALKKALVVRPATLMTHDIATVTDGGKPMAQSSAALQARRVMGRPCPALTLLVWHWLTTSAVTVRREAALAAGGFNTNLRLGEDWDLWLRLLSTPGATLEYLPQVLTDYTVNPAGLSALGLGQKGEKALRALEDLVTSHSRKLAAQEGVGRLWLWVLAWASLQAGHVLARGPLAGYGLRRRGWLLLRQLWRVPVALTALYREEKAV